MSFSNLLAVAEQAAVQNSSALGLWDYIALAVIAVVLVKLCSPKRKPQPRSTSHCVVIVRRR